MVRVGNRGQVYFRRLEVRRLDKMDIWMLEAYAQQPGETLTHSELKELIGTRTTADNLRAYLAHMIQKLASTVSSRHTRPRSRANAR